MVEPSFGSDTTRLSTARSLPGNKERISNGALGLILELGLGDKQLCLDYGLLTCGLNHHNPLALINLTR